MRPYYLSMGLLLATGIALTPLLPGDLSSWSASDAASRQVYHGSTAYVRQMRAADRLIQTGRLPEAETKYTDLLKKNPGNRDVRSRLALVQAGLYKLDASEKNARQVLSADPNHAMARVALGVAYRNRTASHDMTYKSRKEALLADSLKELEQAVNLDPGSPEALNQLGVTYRFLGRSQEAEQAFQKALDADGQYAEALLNQGILKMEQGQYGEAKSLYQKAIQQNSKNESAHYRLGEALLKEGSLHQAIQSLNTALSLNRGNASVMAKLAEAYAQQGNNSAAIGYYRKAILTNPGFMPAYTGLAQIHDLRGDGELAMSELRSALEINPTYNPGRLQLGRLAMTVDKPEQALEAFRESLMLDPSNAEALQGLSQALTMVAQQQLSSAQLTGFESDLVSAEETLTQALKYNPNDLRLHLAKLRISQLSGKPGLTPQEYQTLLNTPAQNDTERLIQGEALLALGRFQESDQVFHQLMEAARGDTTKLLTLADILKTHGDLDRARDAYLKVARIEPDNLKAQRGLQRVEAAREESEKTARLASALNNWRQKESSVDFYEETLRQNPRQPEARLALARLYEKAKDYAKAARSYRYYLGMTPELSEKEYRHFSKKISKLQEKADKATKSSDSFVLSGL